MSQKQASLVGTIDSLLETMGAIPATKKAEAYSEPGSQGGSTTHPTKDVDDSLQKATEGSQSATNEADVEKDQPLGVDKAEAGAGGSQDDKQMNIGITSKPTGEDSAAETDSAKAGKDDPGSSHPARTDNDSLDGMKYASAVERFRAFAKQAEAKGNALVAAVAAASDNAVKAAAKPAAKPAAPAAKAAEAKPADAAQAGAALADDVTADMDKQAAEAILIDAMAETVAVGEDAAMRYIDYMRKCAAAAYNAKKAGKGTKSAAEGDDSSDPKHEAGESSNEETAEHAPGGEEAGGEGGGGGAPSDDELMAALSGGGGDAGAMGGGGDIGAQDAMAGMSGDMGGGAPPADPAAAGGLPGGMPPDAAGGAGGMAPPADPGMGAPGSGGDLSPEDLQVLMHVLQQAGVTPEQLEAAAAQKQAQLLKAAKANKQPIPRWRPKNAAEAQRAEEMLAYVRELTGSK